VLVKVDDALRDPDPAVTEDQRLLDQPHTDDDFRRNDTWRVLRITSEVIEGIDALGDIKRAVAIFGSARIAPSDPYYAAARRTAMLLARADYTIITGGGPGIMEAANRGARDNHGRSRLQHRATVRTGRESVSDTLVASATSSCARRCSKYSSAFIICGGYGIDEMLEALTLIQTGKISHFPVVLFGSEYWRGFYDWLRGTVLAGGKIASPDLELLQITDDPDEAAACVIAAKHH
jgi:uncharacterized protein (TIGR00730 family)